MGRRVLGCLLLVLGLAALSGCVFGSVDEMYALPKSSEAYVNLQTTINQEKGNAEYIAPLSGENRQTIQLVDVDGDGKQEAVAFFRDASSAKPLKIVIFKQDNREDYHVFARIEGVGSEIQSIEYLDLGGAGGSDILVSWQVSASIHSLAGYTITDGQPAQIMHSNYSHYRTEDLDGDGQEEVILAQTEGGPAAHMRIEYYDSRDGVMELVSTAPLSEGTTDIHHWTGGKLAGDAPALFVTSYFGKDVLITDVFTLDQEGGLRNIALDKSGRRSENVFHYYAGVAPEDINKDGITEVPVAQAIPAYGESSVEGFWWLRWMQYQADGSRKQAMRTYHSGDGWYLELPDGWTGEFSMRRQESSSTGVRTVTFARGTQEAAAPFLEITCLVGSDRGRLAQQDNRFLLHANSTTLYTGEFFANPWSCGLTQETIQPLFHVGQDGWPAEE